MPLRVAKDPLSLQQLLEAYVRDGDEVLKGRLEVHFHKLVSESKYIRGVPYDQFADVRDKAVEMILDSAYLASKMQLWGDAFDVNAYMKWRVLGAWENLQRARRKFSRPPIRIDPETGEACEIEPADPDAHRVERQIEARDCLKAIRKCLKILPERKRYAIRLAWEGADLEEVAARLGMSYIATRKMLSRLYGECAASGCAKEDIAFTKCIEQSRALAPDRILGG